MLPLAGSYLIIKSIFNWYLPLSSLFYWLFPAIYLLVFGSSFLRRSLRVTIFNLLSLWYFPLESCRSIYQSSCSRVLSSVASCLLFISPIVTNQDYLQPFLSVTIGLLGPFYPILFASSSIRVGPSGIWYLAGMLNLGLTIYKLGSSLTWSSRQTYQPSPSFTIPGSLVLETSPSRLFLLTHTIRLNLWFCRLYGFFGPLLYELYVRQSLSYNLPVITLQSFTNFCYARLRNRLMPSTASIGTMPLAQGGIVQFAFRSEITALRQLLPEKDFLRQLTTLRYLNLRIQWICSK